MHVHTVDSLGERVVALERRLMRWRWLTAFAITAAVSYACARVIAGERAPAPDSSMILRARGLVIEDASGRPRMLFGMPVPGVPERLRKDAANGIVVLGADGVDRLQFGHVGGPQMGGKVNARTSPATGLMVNDAAGDERAGFGLFDNGQAGWGLDFPGGEGLIGIVDPARKLSGVAVLAESETNPMRAMLASQDGATTLTLHDGNGKMRAQLRAKAGEPAALTLFDENGAATPTSAAPEKH